MLLASACLFPGFDELLCESDCGGSSATATPTGAGPQGGGGSGASPSGGTNPGGAPPTGGAGGGGGGPANPCADPLGRGADGVLVDTPGDFPLYCIDSVEVSWAHYIDFLNALTFMSEAEFDELRPNECGFVALDADAFQTFYGYPGILSNTAEHDLPAVGMNWCEAQIHCHWAGKKLCGDIDGVSPESADVDQAQWVAACSNFGANTYSYPGPFDPDICRSDACVNDFHGLDPALPNACEGGLPGLFNMSGNVHELTDNCVPAGGAGFEDDLCQLRGGNCNLGEYTDCKWDQAVERADKDPGNYQSFRCCWGPP
jgi:sulfatase modifying factor 1